MPSRHFMIGAAILSALLVSVPVRAGVIAVANGSFEDPVVGTFNTGPVTNWTIGGFGGVYNNGAGVYVAPDGVQVGYAGPAPTGSGYGILMQSVGAVTPGITYTLKVDVGERADEYFVDYRLLLGVWAPGGHDLATAAIFAAAYNPSPIAPGTFSQATLTGFAPLNLTGDLVIFLENSNSFPAASQTAWDNVTLSANVPEVSTWAMMIMGFMGVGFLAYRRKQPGLLASRLNGEINCDERAAAGRPFLLAGQGQIGLTKLARYKTAAIASCSSKHRLRVVFSCFADLPDRSSIATCHAVLCDRDREITDCSVLTGCRLGFTLRLSDRVTG